MPGAGSFLPHATCYLFNQRLMWLHGASDGIIALAYYAIPLEILYFTSRRRDLPFPMVFIAFAVFILGCGTTHLMEVVTLFYPFYWTAGGIKAITAAASLATAVGLTFVLPQALSMRSAQELGDLNQRLVEEVRQRAKAEQELLKSRDLLIRQERMRVAGQLASGMAHDLNNTLNVIKLRLALLSSDAALVEKHSKSMAAIDRAVEDAARTVARVQEFGKAREESRDTADLGKVIGAAVELARTSIEEQSSFDGAPITIVMHLPDALPFVRGSESELRQVFLNLLINAKDAMNHHGTIEIDAEIEAGALVVRVSDQGSGIPHDSLTRIFEPFFTTKGPRGTGLGLSISREIIEANGGSVTAQNLPEGGALFTLRFALARGESAPSQPEIQRAPAAIGECRFLLVDDDVENLEAMRALLELNGYKADTARSGEEALEKIKAGTRYQVILCDLGMPGMNGWDTAREFARLAPGSSFYIVTGWGRRIDLENAPPVPVAGVIPKPVDPSAIERIVAAVRAGF